MKTCPECGEILGDSVKICVNCKYQFQQSELQEVLDRNESIQKISQELMASHRKKIIIRSCIVLFVCLLVTSCIAIFGIKFKKVGDGIMLGPSLLTQYDYTLYPDHVVLNMYHGTETEVYIPNSLWGRPVTEIGKGCFSQTERPIHKVQIPETVIEIQEGAFWGERELTEVTGGKEVRVVGIGAFALCEKLAVVDLGTKIEVIGVGAFEWCEQLKRFERQDHLEHIGQHAFWQSGLEEFEFNPNAKIWYEAFEGTPWLDNQQE